jgi:hypothetical protein
MTVNEVKELAPGVFWALMWCPTAALFARLLRPDGYVLIWEHRVGNYSWQEYLLPVVAPTEPVAVLGRSVEMDVLVPTSRFAELLPRLRPAIKAVQLGNLPPDYLDMRRIKGAQLYRLLQDCNWHLLIDTPANDYGQIMSPDRQVVEQAIALSAQGQH